MSNPTYFDTQGQCSSILGIDEQELKDWKRQGCPAFKHGRIYRAPLLKWIEAKKAKVRGPSDVAGDPDKETRRAIIAFAQQYERGAIDFREFFDRTTLLVEALGDQAVMHEWIRQVFYWLREDFPKLTDAHKVHPRIVEWLCRQGGAKYRAPSSGKRASRK